MNHKVYPGIKLKISFDCCGNWLVETSTIATVEVHEEVEEVLVETPEVAIATFIALIGLNGLWTRHRWCFAVDKRDLFGKQSLGDLVLIIFRLICFPFSFHPIRSLSCWQTISDGLFVPYGKGWNLRSWKINKHILYGRKNIFDIQKKKNSLTKLIFLILFFSFVFLNWTINFIHTIKINPFI